VGIDFPGVAWFLSACDEIFRVLLKGPFRKTPGGSGSRRPLGPGEDDPRPLGDTGPVYPRYYPVITLILPF
jgi:hypothetical protein